MVARRVLVGYGLDLDAVANHINTRNGSPADLSDISRGVFGATVGTERLLKMFNQKNIKASWFIPGHTVETFPEQTKMIFDQGHEIGLHNYTHEYPSDLDREQFKAILVKTIDIITKVTGQKPKGFTAPAWANSTEQISLLKELGIVYDHSFMHDDFKPYYVSEGTEKVYVTNVKNHPETWMKPMEHAPKSDIVEIPANIWMTGHLSNSVRDVFDMTLTMIKCSSVASLELGLPSQGYVDPRSIEQGWKDMFTYCYREMDTFIFPISVHPQVSGRPHILMMHERFIDWVNTHEGVEWCTFGQMAEEFKAGRI